MYYSNTSKTQISDEHRRKEFQRLNNTNLEVKFEITVKIHNLSPRPIPSHTTVKFKSLPHPFIATNISLFDSDHNFLSTLRFYPLLKHIHNFKRHFSTLTFSKEISL